MNIEAASFDSMNYGELEVFEEIVGVIPSEEADLENVPKVKLMIAMGYIQAKRDNPEITLDEVKALPLGSITFKDEEEESDPS